MEEDSWESVMQRALAAGVITGTPAGGLLAAYIAVDLPGGFSFSGALGVGVIAVIGVVIGAFTGFLCAIPAGLILATARRFLERHLCVARLCGSMLGGLLLASLTMSGYGLTVSGPGADGWFIAAAFGLGSAVAGLNVKFVVTGKQCLAARCLTRRHAG